MNDTAAFEKKRLFFGCFLFFFATYTLLIKYILPISWAFMQGEPWRTYIYFWDAWWIFHIAVGIGFVRRMQHVWWWAFLLTIAELVIIGIKLTLYYWNPNLDFWHLQWAINKTLMLFYFIFLFVWLVQPSVRKELL